MQNTFSFVVIVLSLNLSNVVTKEDEKTKLEIGKFVTDNNWSSISVISVSNIESRTAARNLSHHLAKNIKSKVLLGSLAKNFHAKDSFTILCLFGNISDKEWIIFSKMVPTLRRKSALLIIQDLTALRQKLYHIDDNYFVYVFDAEDASHASSWYQAVGIASVTDNIFQPIQFSNGSMCAKELTNLDGIQLESISLTYEPVLMMDDCHETLYNCSVTGYQKDIFDRLEQMLNFTTVYIREPNNDWGLSRTNSTTGETYLTGVLGGIESKAYPMSISNWWFYLERIHYAEILVTGQDMEVLTLSKQQPSTDLGLFIRPFRDEAWIGVGVVTAIIIVLIGLYASPLSSLMAKDPLSMRIVYTSAWAFFVLTNSYYGGALTMFFASDVSVPFESIKEVIAHPDWKLIYQKGNV